MIRDHLRPRGSRRRREKGEGARTPPPVCAANEGVAIWSKKPMEGQNGLLGELDGSVVAELYVIGKVLSTGSRRQRAAAARFPPAPRRAFARPSPQHVQQGNHLVAQGQSTEGRRVLVKGMASRRGPRRGPLERCLARAEWNPRVFTSPSKLCKRSPPFALHAARCPQTWGRIFRSARGHRVPPRGGRASVGLKGGPYAYANQGDGVQWG